MTEIFTGADCRGSQPSLPMRVAVLLLLPLLGACATTAEFRKLERDVYQLKKNVNATDSSNSVQADLLTQMEALQREVQELQGRLDVTEHRALQALEEAKEARRAAARTGQTTLLSPATGEFAAEGAISPAEAAAQPAQSPAAAPAPAAAVPAPTPPSANPLAAAAPPAPAPAPAPLVAARPPEVPANANAGGIDALAADPELAAAADGKVTTAEELQAYRNAYAAWRSGDTQTCIDRFRQFLQTYPPSGYADDASYWMADCYFKQGDYKTAIVRFDDVVRTYPKGNKAADALYRQGESLLKLGPGYSKAASKAFERVIKEYPGSPRVEEAKQQLELLGA